MTPGAVAAGVHPALLEAVRERVQISELFPPGALRRQGREYVSLCPWHDDHNASLTVSPQRNRVHCFVCNRGADAIGWLQERQGLSFREAVEELARRYAIPIPEQDRTAALQAAAEQRERGRILALRQEQQQRFQQALAADLQARGPGAMFLAKRGITPATAEAWGLGLNGRRLMLPVRDGQGRCCGFCGRTTTAQEPKYRNSSGDALFRRSALLFGLDRAAAAIRRSGEALLVEGPLDVIQLHQAGICTAVAALGTALAAGQRELLQRSGVRRLLLALDGDRAGVAATARLIAELRPLAISGRLELQVLPLPDGSDPDALVRSGGAEAWQACLSRRRHWLEWELDQLLAPLAAAGARDDLTVLQRCEREGAQLLASLPAGLLRQRAAERLQRALGVVVRPAAGGEPAREAARAAASQAEPLQGAATAGADGADGAEQEATAQAERRALRLFLCSPDCRPVLAELQLRQPLHREALGLLWRLEQRLIPARGVSPAHGDTDSGTGSDGDGLMALLQAVSGQLDPTLAALLAGLSSGHALVCAELQRDPATELAAVLEVLEALEHAPAAA